MLRLPAAAAAALRQAARREGTTLYMLLLAGFAALLARLTGEEDLLVGTPVADRPQPELEGLIGFFVNTVVIRARVAGDPSFRGLLASVRDTALGAFAHQDLPFEMLVEALRPERERSRNPLVQTLFAFQGADRATAGTAADTTGLRLVRLPWGERSTAKLDFVLSARVFEKLNVRFSADNLTDADYEFTQGAQLQRLFNLGRTFTLNFGFSPF